MVLPVLGAIFAIWAGADLISYYFTGNDTVWLFAHWMGWTQSADGSDVLTIVTGSSLTDFIVNNWFFICILLSVLLFILWFSTRPLKVKT